MKTRELRAAKAQPALVAWTYGTLFEERVSKTLKVTFLVSN